MPRYLNPKNDLPFKRIFGEHPDLLKSFLNALMPLEENQQIVSLEYLSPEQVPENPGKKYSIVDVRCKDNFGR
ncbi:MAG: Rpn family recombination-promoting nuclease/putative transposase, partial [Odoribacteraceae bacterium]|nr:Rpn family recombination-promoting nuclease/putative transposase [Odoribacteraceae bacterium]